MLGSVARFGGRGGDRIEGRRQRLVKTVLRGGGWRVHSPNETSPIGPLHPPGLTNRN